MSGIFPPPGLYQNTSIQQNAYDFLQNSIIKEICKSSKCMINFETVLTRLCKNGTDSISDDNILYTTHSSIIYYIPVHKSFAEYFPRPFYRTKYQNCGFKVMNFDKVSGAKRDIFDCLSDVLLRAVSVLR